MIELSEGLAEKYRQLKDSIHKRERLLVAFSGGVDSAVLAKVAFDELGDSAWAVLVNSETVPQFELSEAAKVADKIGINFKVIEIQQLSDENFIKNDANRCHFCRKKMAIKLHEFAKDLNIHTIAAGAQATDLDDYRPGIKAFESAGILHPFIELDFSKQDIRNLAKYLGLPVSAKPAMACLSSRVQYGQKITKKNLSMIATAEDHLRELGFSQYRARTHGNLLRIEIFPTEFEILLQNRENIIKYMKGLGYDFVTLDLVGFKSGSMNVDLE
jgi:uncharacterized protein